MPIVDMKAGSIAELVPLVLEVAKKQPADTFLWYRGLSSSDHKLLPGLLRDGRRAEEIFDRERRLLTRFRQRSLPFWPAGYPQNDWEHLFAMQHYGIPTRLLDWSENLFFAVHFALGGDANNAETNPVVWCINPIVWNRSTPILSEFGDSIQVLTTSDDDLEAYRPETSKRRNKSPVAMFGTHNSARIVAQRGTFIVWGEDARPLEDFTGEMKCDVWRIELVGKRLELSSELSALGFGETMIFPELESLANELRRVEGWRELKK